jgi:hypothetical protein
VFTALLHSNESYSIVACVFVAAGICLPSRCLAMDVYSDFTIPALGVMSQYEYFPAFAWKRSERNQVGPPGPSQSLPLDLLNDNQSHLSKFMCMDQNKHLNGLKYWGSIPGRTGGFLFTMFRSALSTMYHRIPTDYRIL